MLIPARLLVNGASIVQETGFDTVTYFHVELAEHAILLAEALEAESYLDTGNRAMFENAGTGLCAPGLLDLPARAAGRGGDVRASRTARACDTQPWLDDRRRLGVAVGRMLVRNGAEVTEIAADDPDLAEGWWGAESDGRRIWRWTAGDAHIALPFGANMLEVHVVGTMG